MYPEFRILMDYMNRMSEALSGRHVAPVALLYHAEGEWSGEYMLTQKPAAVMAKALIDYDIVPIDYLFDGISTIKDDQLQIGSENFRALVIPYAQALPAALLEKIGEFAAFGLPVYFVDGLPERTSEGLALPGLAAFAGRIRYSLQVNLTAGQAARNASLVITGVQEGAKVTVNGTDCGTRICPPYRYCLTGALTEGENDIMIEVNTTQGRRQNDFLCQFLLAEPVGITGQVTLELKDR